MSEKEILIKECHKLAIKLLEDYGEFYPFAYGILEGQKKVSIIEPNIEREHPESIELINNLTEGIHTLHQLHHFNAVCICSNVIIKENNNESSALEIRLDIKEQGATNVYIPYQLISGKASTEPQNEEDGTFKLFQAEINPNEAVFTLKQIMWGNNPILYVFHDEENNWQFLTGEASTMNELMIVGLNQITARDPSINNILNLPTGFEAYREHKDAEWVITKSE